MIAVLKSPDASLQKKDAACARLKIIGTDKCIPALEGLLLDKDLSHSARYALEPMSSEKAEQALLEALKKTQGPIRVGIISSLGVRHDEKAVSPLARLLKDSDTATTKAAYTALGQIGSASALKPLMQSLREREGIKERMPRELPDGILRCANNLLASGKQSAALSAFKELGRSPWIDTGTKLAVYAGMIRASGKDGLHMETAALRGGDALERAAGLKLAPELKLPGTTEALAAILPGLQPQCQSALIEALQRRNDPAAARPIAALATSNSPEVRMAVINALRDLGDEKQAGLLVKMAASSQGEEQSAARLALVDLRRGAVTAELLKLLKSADSRIGMEAARALGQRGDRKAVPGLLEMAKSEATDQRKPVLQALSLLAGEAELSALLDLVSQAKSKAARAEAAEAAGAAYQRCQATTGHAPVQPLVAKLNSADPETRAALMPLCSSLNAPEIQSALQHGLHDSNPAVRQSAIRAVCETSDPKLLPDVVQLAREAEEENFKTMAISACVRLTSPEENPNLSNAERIEPLQSILESSLNTAQKRQILAGLGEVGDLRAFRLVEPLLKETEVQAEASQAAVGIAAKLTGREATEAVPTLRTVVASNVGENLRKAASQTLNQIQTRADYLTSWQIAGPYMQAGKNYATLFDVPFPPEAADNDNGADGVKWKTVENSGSGGGSNQKPWVIDLLKALGGEQRVAYARTWIHCDQEEPARLELGTDDGVKVWLNHKLVHAHNVARPLQEGADKVAVRLSKGWNELLLKVTQNNLGWEFCAKLVKADGSHLEGLVVAAEPK